MIFKRVLCFLLIISFVVTLNACGCEHEWTEATCEAPKTCKLCGDTEGELGEHDFADPNCVTPKKCKVCGTVEGEVLGHNFAEADCVTPKKCKTCGVIEGEALGHDFSEADCDTPKMCVVCGTTVGTALGHNYTSGYCERCGSPDPDYQALHDYGFSNMNGMNVWLELSTYYLYDFEKNCVYYDSFSFSFDFLVFNDNYFRSGSAKGSDIKRTSNVTPEMIDLHSATPYRTVSNDVISYNGFGECTITINKRYIDSDNSSMVLEVIESGKGRKYYVPADLLDFSTVEAYSTSSLQGSPLILTTYKINFK
ncbi:MAG: hypothetical protein J6D06_01905 [Clostridia bacterium]|nr:hypothetical protein [Clostridia bacterium]